MNYSNLHTHTTFSDGVGTPLENVKSAIEKGMTSLGFSDHSFTACDTSYCMKEEDYPFYIKAISSLKEEYRDVLPIYLGLEKDYYSEGDDSAFDYIIASVHYICRNGVCYPIDHSAKQQKECAAEVFGGSFIDMAACYFDMLTEHVIRTKPTFIGHFDVITKFSLMPEEDERYRDIAKAALKECLKHCKYLEMNTGAISRGWRKDPYPNEYLLETVRACGGKVLLGSDSHNPNNLIFDFDRSCDILRNAGFESISVFNGNGYTDLAL